jgi:hypothetical protein
MELSKITNNFEMHGRRPKASGSFLICVNLRESAGHSRAEGGVSPFDKLRAGFLTSAAAGLQSEKERAAIPSA